MSLSVYLWGVRLITLLSFSAWIGIIVAVDPYEAGVTGMVLFFSSLFATLLGVLMLILTSLCGLTGTASVTISCTPTNSCSSASSDTRAAGICAGDTFTITDGCGGTLTCSGTRVCDYNWKEVAP